MTPWGSFARRRRCASSCSTRSRNTKTVTTEDGRVYAGPDTCADSGPAALRALRGRRLYVSAHDRYDLETQRRFKRKIRAAHPDVNHQRWAPGHTRQLLRKRERWEQSEGAWYARFRLDPPN
jgi:hypothetical protein